MVKTRLCLPMVLLVVGLLGSPAMAQPDVIVGDLQQVWSWGHVGDVYAYSVGTTSCNIGNVPLQWQANNNLHPVIGQELYRLKDGQFEQVGISWLKHGFCALSQTLCGPCQSTNCNTLGVGCSDPYTATRNGEQSNLGPRFDVNAHTGVYNYPFPTQGQTGNVVFKRLQVDIADVNPALNPGALYFTAGHYVTQDDAQAGNGDNNASWRQVQIGATPNTYPLGFVGGQSTVREEAAIMAWQAHDPMVVIENVRVPNEGLMQLGYRVTNNGNGTYRYEYALYNMNSDISAGSFSVPLPPGVVLTNIEFHGVPYHSGEPYDGDAWTTSMVGNDFVWSTDSFAANPNAFALRWSRLYNFRFDANAIPQADIGEVGLFKQPGFVEVDILAPGIVIVPGPVSVTCESTPTGVQLDWFNIVPYTEIIVSRDGVQIDTLPGDSTSYFDPAGAAEGNYSYSLVGFMGPDPSPSVNCFVEVPLYPELVRGDCNNDGMGDISDAIFFLSTLFAGSVSDCESACDANDDGMLDVADAVMGLLALFGNPPAILPPPFPGCGVDPSVDELECLGYSNCP